METVKRTFTIADQYMIEHSKVKRLLFIDDQAQFVGLDPDYANPYEDDWATAIGLSETQPTDEIILDQVTQLTAAIDTQMTLCRNKFQDTKRFIEKAFPNNPGVWNEFGYNNYDAQRRSQTGMIEFMKLLHTTATKYSAQLIAANYLAPAIAEIATLRTALDNANNAQELFIAQRPLATQTRVNAHNHTWTYSVSVARAAKSIFRNDPARYNMYLLPASEEDQSALKITGTVTDKATGQPIQGAQVKIVALGIAVTTDSNGRYGIANLASGTYELLVSAAFYQVVALSGIEVDADSGGPTVADAALIAA